MANDIKDDNMKIQQFIRRGNKYESKQYTERIYTFYFYSY